MRILRKIIYSPVWFITLFVFVCLSLIDYTWIMIKKKKLSQKIIYSDFIQTWKQRIAGRPKIIKSL